FFVYGGGPVTFQEQGFPVLSVTLLSGPFSEPDEPYNGVVEGTVVDEHAHGNEILNFISAHSAGRHFFFEVFDDNSVDYSFSNAPVSVDLTQATQHGGFAEGDRLDDIFEVTGSAFDDVIRGSNVSDFPPDTSRTIDGQPTFFFTINKPGENVLNG